MKRTLSPQQAISFFHEEPGDKKNIVLVGGCFDILHEGHLKFLTSSKATGDILLVLLESDESIRDRKGKNRPYNSQQKRAEQLIKTTVTDCVILLPHPFTDKDYDNLVTRLKPAIIATTIGDPYKYHKDRQATMIGARVLEVIRRLPEYSSTQLIKKNE